MLNNQPQKKYFGTDGLRGRVGRGPITADFILKLGWAAGKILCNDERGTIIIGKDTRLSGYMFESALEAGLSAAGVDIKLLGPMPTPAIAYLTRTLRAQAGIVISASHNQFHDNGIKFFDHNGFKLSPETELAIEEQLEKNIVTVDSAKLGKASRVVDAAGRYIEFCKSTYKQAASLNGLKIVVDCANGAGYHIAPSVFRELGADVTEIGTEPDGLNINDDCGSTHPEYLRKMVLFEGADLGIALDGDADRVLLVDHKGEVLDGDEILYIIANDWLERGLFYGGMVGTVMSNLGLELTMQSLEIPFIRTQVGDKHIIAELTKNNWILGGEPSGHIICSQLITTGDGIIAGIQTLAAMLRQNKSLHELKQGLIKLPQSTINVSISQRPQSLENKDIVDAVKTAEHALGKHGRVLLRPSGTEPVIRVMVEGAYELTFGSLAKDLAEVVENTFSPS